MRQIAIATVNYALDNKGKVPPRYQLGVSCDVVGPLTWAYFGAATAGGVSQADANILTLVDRGYLSGNPASTSLADVPWLWCPAAIDGTSAAPGNLLSNSSYFYNPHDRYGGNQYIGSGGYDSRYTRLDKIPASRCLVLDMMWYPNSYYHQSPNGSCGFNMAYTDGHVDFVQDEVLYQYMVSNYGTNGYSKDWQVSEAVDYLETVDQGGNPQTTSIIALGASLPHIFMASAVGTATRAFTTAPQPARGGMRSMRLP